MLTFSQWSRKKKMQYMNIINDLSETDSEYNSNIKTGAWKKLLKLRQTGESDVGNFVLKKRSPRISPQKGKKKIKK